MAPTIMVETKRGVKRINGDDLIKHIKYNMLLHLYKLWTSNFNVFLHFCCVKQPTAHVKQQFSKE